MERKNGLSPYLLDSPLFSFSSSGEGVPGWQVGIVSCYAGMVHHLPALLGQRENGSPQCFIAPAHPKDSPLSLLPEKKREKESPAGGLVLILFAYLMHPSCLPPPNATYPGLHWSPLLLAKYGVQVYCYQLSKASSTSWEEEEAMSEPGTFNSPICPHGYSLEWHLVARRDYIV